MKNLLFFLLFLTPFLASGQTVSVYINGGTVATTNSSWVTKSVNDTLTNTEIRVKANAASANISITLPSPASCVGLEFVIKKVDQTSHTVTLIGTIDGATNYVIHTSNESITISSDGTSFLII